MQQQVIHGSRKRRANHTGFAEATDSDVDDPSYDAASQSEDDDPDTGHPAAVVHNRSPRHTGWHPAAAAAAAAATSGSPSSAQPAAGVIMVPCSRRFATHGWSLSKLLFPQLQLGDTVPLTITVQPHDSSWDAAAYVSSTGGAIPAAVKRRSNARGGQLVSTGAAWAQAPPPESGAAAAAPPAAQPAAPAATGPGPCLLGPYSCSIKVKDSPDVFGLPAHASTELKPYAGSWDIVLQEKVGASSLVLHIKPGDPLQQASRRPVRTKLLAGSVTGVDVKSTVVLGSPHVANVNIPKSLLASQFPGAAFPMAVKLTVNDSSNVAMPPGAAATTQPAIQGADSSQPAGTGWGPELFPESRIHTSSNGYRAAQYRLMFSVTPSTRQLVGRSVSHISASPPNSLTLHLAAAAGAPADAAWEAGAAPAVTAGAAQHAGGGGSLTAAPVSSPSSSRSVKRHRASQQQQAAAAAGADAVTAARLGGHMPAPAGLSIVMGGSQGHRAGNGPPAAAAAAPPPPPPPPPAAAAAAAGEDEGLMQWFDSDADDSDGAASSGASLEGTADGTHTSTGHAAAAAGARAAPAALAAAGRAAGVGGWQLQGSLSAAAGVLGPTGAAAVPPVTLTTSPGTAGLIKQEPLAVTDSPAAAWGTAAAGSGGVSRMSAHWLLPPGLVLRDAADPLSMKQQLQDLLDSLEGLVAPEQLASWMEGVQDRMQPFRRQQQQQGGAGAGRDEEWGWLLTDYRYLQRAVAGRQLQQVAKALSALLRQE